MADDFSAKETMRLISFKATDADRALMARMAIGSESVSAFLRQLVRDAAGQYGPSLPVPVASPRRRFKSVPIAHRPPPDPELVRQLAMIANLLNQLATDMHLCRHNGTVVDLTVVHFMLLAIDGHMEYLREAYTTAAIGEVNGTPREESP